MEARRLGDVGPCAVFANKALHVFLRLENLKSDTNLLAGLRERCLDNMIETILGWQDYLIVRDADRRHGIRVGPHVVFHELDPLVFQILTVLESPISMDS